MRYMLRGPYLLLRTLGAVTFGLVLAATALATKEVKLDAIEFGFAPATVKVDAGRVSFVVTNMGRFPHGFAIDGITESIPKIAPGKTATLTLDLPKGSYTFFCPVKGHRAKGMEGALGAGVAPKAAEKAPAPAPKRSWGY